MTYRKIVLARNVADLRATTGWTQKEFARSCQVSIGTVHAIEQGLDVNPKVDTLVRIAEQFKIEAGALLLTRSKGAHGRPLTLEEFVHVYAINADELKHGRICLLCDMASPPGQAHFAGDCMEQLWIQGTPIDFIAAKLGFRPWVVEGILNARGVGTVEQLPVCHSASACDRHVG